MVFPDPYACMLFQLERMEDMGAAHNFRVEMAAQSCGEEQARYGRDKRIKRMCLKTIVSGGVLESECFPVWDTRSSMSRAPKRKECRTEQRNLNTKNAIKNVVRLMNTNFTNADCWFTGTFTEKTLPRSWKETNRYAANFIRRLDRYAKKHGYPTLKYIYVSVYTNGKQERAHIHVVTNFPDRDKMESLWHEGIKETAAEKKDRLERIKKTGKPEKYMPFCGRTNARRLQADKFGYEGLARYIANNAHGTRRYTASKNLARPTITRAYCRMSRGRAEKIVKGLIDAKTEFERIYKGYKFSDMNSFVSDYVSGHYVYVRMRRLN